MSTSKQSSQSTPASKLHPGSSEKDAMKMGGKRDFGVPEEDVVERTYTSRNTLASDPGKSMPRSSTDRTRTSGVGGNDSGPGSGSGGDLDTRIVGVGTRGRGVSQSGKVNEPPGPDDTSGGAQAFASGPPAQGKNQNEPLKKVEGTTVQPGDDRSTGPHGADASANPDPGNPASAGEVSTSESAGADN
jgi:hypothetical protein